MRCCVSEWHERGLESHPHHKEAIEPSLTLSDAMHLATILQSARQADRFIWATTYCSVGLPTADGLHRSTACLTKTHEEVPQELA